MEIINNFDRLKLSEGRNFGIGFAFLKKITNNKFETLNAFTACKDYLNDLIYVETTKKNLTRIHGFKHEITNELDNSL